MNDYHKISMEKNKDNEYYLLLYLPRTIIYSKEQQDFYCEFNFSYNITQFKSPELPLPLLMRLTDDEVSVDFIAFSIVLFFRLLLGVFDSCLHTHIMWYFIILTISSSYSYESHNYYQHRY